MFTGKKLICILLVLLLCLSMFGCQNGGEDPSVTESIDVEASIQESIQVEKDRVEAEKEAYNQMVEERIIDILESTPAVNGWALTLAQAINGTFHNYEWTFEQSDGTIWYDVTFAGYYSPNPRDLPQLSYQGSITWRINIDSGEVVLWNDSNNISDAFILLALPY